MKLYTFEINQQRRVGAEWSGQLVDLSAAYEAYVRSQTSTPTLRSIPAEIASIIRLGQIALEAARFALTYVRKRPALPVGIELIYPFDAVKILPPLRPGKILCSGINNDGTIEEDPNRKTPSEPFVFSKFSSSIIGPGEVIIKPRLTEKLDHDLGFAAVVGQPMNKVPEESVMNSIFGYTILHDISARDVQLKNQQVTLAKNFDTFCPLGPCIVTRDELPEPASIHFRSTLNGNVLYNGTGAEGMFPLARLLSFLSQVMTLEPGDVVSTSTRAGRKPPVFLKPGDKISVEIDGIGRLENKVMGDA